METPARQERTDDPPGAPRKSKHQMMPQRKLRPKKLRYDLGVDEETPSNTSKEELYALLESRINNTEGTWVQCCEANCGKWRYLQDMPDPNDVPDKWYCFMNKDPQYNSCEAAEQDMSQEEFVDTKFFVGSIVWAKLASYPWWPAMIDDDPDSYIYFCNEDPYDEDRVTHYNVTFLDKNVTRAWIREDHCMPFHRDGCPKNKVTRQYERAFNDAVKRAEHAVTLPLSERIAEYCFVNNYPPLKSTSLRRTLAKSKRPKKKSSKGETQHVTSDSQPAKRPRGRPPKVRTATQEQTQKTKPAGAATSPAGASKPLSRKAKGTTAPSSSNPRPKVKAAAETIRKTQERKDALARKKTLKHQRPKKNAADAALIGQQHQQLVLPTTAETLQEQSLPLVQPQIQAQSRANVSVPASNKTPDLPLVPSSVTVPANCPSNNDQELKACQEAQKQGTASPTLADEADTLPPPQRFDAATKQSRVLGQPEQVTEAPALKSQNGTQASSDTPLLFTYEQTQENLEDIADVNSLIQFIDEDVEKHCSPKGGTSSVTTAMAEAETEMVPASIATASGELFSQLALKELATASAPIFSEASHNEQGNSAASNETQSGTDFVPEVSPVKQVKQALPKFFKQKASSKEDKENKARKEVNSKPKKTKNPSTKEPAADIAMQPSMDAATPAKPAKASVKAARKATASVKPTMAPATRTLGKTATDAPAKQTTVPANTADQAATVLLPKPAAMLSAVVPPEKAVVPAKPAVKTGSTDRTVSAKQAATKAPNHKRLFKVPTKESISQAEASAPPKEAPVVKTNSQDKFNSSGSWTAQSEDSDFEALSGVLSLTFEDSLSSKSLSQNLETDCDTDFVSLEAVDCSQCFDMEE
ncbi:unnamed protein product [Ixodes hexagonus]